MGNCDVSINQDEFVTFVNFPTAFFSGQTEALNKGHIEKNSTSVRNLASEKKMDSSFAKILTVILLASLVTDGEWHDHCKE